MKTGLGASLALAVAACGSGSDVRGRTADAGADAAADARPAEAGRAPDARTGDGGATGGDSGAGHDGGHSRPFRLATTGAKLLVTGADLGLQLTPAHVADDSDVIAIHQEFYGVPWDAFEAQTAPPAEWASVMDRLAAGARAANKPVFLSVSPLNGTRETLAAKTTIENGSVKTNDAWAAPCYDFRAAPDGASKRAAYLRYVAYMVNEFHPSYLNVAIEVNLFFEKCASASAGVIDVVNATYDAVKAQSASTLVFPSFQIDHLYGYSKDTCPDPTRRDACFDAAYAVIAPIFRDRFAMSTYPFMDDVGSVASLPQDWFSRGAARGGERPLVAETGWLSTPLVAKTRASTCYTLFTYDEKDAGAYLERLLADAETANLDLVTWWSNEDLVTSELMTDCPCAFDATWCTVLDIFRGQPQPGTVDTQLFGEVLLKAFGTMGLRDYSGSPKAALFGPWKKALARPFAP